MYSISRCWWLFTVTVGCMMALAAPAALGQAFYFVGKAQHFVQTTATGAVADPFGEYSFGAEAGTNVTLSLPSGVVQPLTFNAGDNTFDFEQTFASKTTLDAAFPVGTYRMTGTGLPTLSFNLSTDDYPTAIPQVSGGTWNPGGLLVLNPAQANTINISTNSSYATAGVAGHMGWNIRGLTDNVDLGTEFGTRAVFGLTLQAAPPTSFTIPAGALTSGRAYEGEIVFDTITTLDTSSVPGGGVIATIGRTLRFYVAAQAPGTTTPPPVITAQPTNQTTTLGGTVTFNLGVTVGGAPATNLFTQWLFNGRTLSFNNTKYQFSNNGLIVRNVTAADVGNYAVRLVNAGGIVTSATATLTLGAAAGLAITRQPVAQNITQGSTVVFSVAATGTPTPTYQWRRDGVNLPGATGATLVIPAASAAQAGAYTVVITNGGNPVVTSPAALTVVAGSNDPGRLINLSILTALTAGETMTMGTVLGGGGTSGAKPLLARAAGPALTQLGVTGVLPDPTMTLVNTSAGTTVATNNDWGGTVALSNAFAQVGAFAYAAPTSRDAAIFQQGLAPANYTVQVSDAGSGVGSVIAELYDATAAGTFSGTTPRLINVSVLKQINAGATLIAGFYVGGVTAKTVLIRAIGPALGLEPFNISGVMADPQLTLFNSAQVEIAANNDWGGDPQLSNTGTRVGAFAIANGASRDAMLLITLAPGSYTAQVSAAGPGGTAIVEVYEVP